MKMADNLFSVHLLGVNGMCCCYLNDVDGNLGVEVFRSFWLCDNYARQEAACYEAVIIEADSVEKEPSAVKEVELTRAAAEHYGS